VLIVSAALYRFDASIELAALSLGASRLQAIWHVTLPSIRPAVAAGAVFAFLTSFDDATVSFFLANLTDVTLPRKMFENLQFFISPVLAVVATLLTVVTLVLVGGVQWLRAGRVE
jgi:mannopine transport system permease protein